MFLEMQEGRGIGGKRYMYLDVRPETVNKYAASDGRMRPDGSPYIVTAEEILSKLPDIVDFCRTYLGVDPVSQPMPVQPTAHYAMGGIPTNKFGEVLLDEKNTILPGLFAAGEAACVSVHGANRLGTNSLLDILVFGKYSGLKAAEFARESGFPTLPKDPTEFARIQFDGLLNSSGEERPEIIAGEMKQVMNDFVGVFRTGEGMSRALETVRELQERFKHVKVEDKGKVFNTDLLATWELGNLIDLAEVTTVAALAREESRGAHAREDFPKRDDENWMKHSLIWQQDGEIELRYKPVNITKFEPKERVY
jgi:succinate dehydrogenase / fumarate reductase flavoprotein subunit